MTATITRLHPRRVDTQSPEELQDRFSRMVLTALAARNDVVSEGFPTVGLQLPGAADWIVSATIHRRAAVVAAGKDHHGIHRFQLDFPAVSELVQLTPREVAREAMRVAALIPYTAQVMVTVAN
ncbi:hypothetical protein [Mycolicibacterium mageritense]|uniref:hypothetical protein n=1 Tax=Mycolicibacterium mageritense TaxID=53462 RepID=UPI0011DBCBEC|nr:hypothetical protein [Mycolicibacterium mageritense]TXI62483.1 MAG: hypothetical protein E6Q55_12735 [Mycolicibacterium mageritense]